MFQFIQLILKHTEIWDITPGNVIEKFERLLLFIRGTLLLGDKKKDDKKKDDSEMLKITTNLIIKKFQRRGTSLVVHWKNPPSSVGNADSIPG